MSTVMLPRCSSRVRAYSNAAFRPARREMTRVILAVTHADAGDDHGAMELARLAVEHASDDATRSTAYWALAEAHWLGGREGTIAASEMALDLPLGSFPGHGSTRRKSANRHASTTVSKSSPGACWRMLRRQPVGRASTNSAA